MTDEVSFLCPYCAQSISMVLDLSVGQTYVEDCEVCCQPIEIAYGVEGGSVSSLEVRRVS